MVGDVAYVLIPPNAPVPAVGRQVFTTVHDGQGEISVLVLEGDFTQVGGGVPPRGRGRGWGGGLPGAGEQGLDVVGRSPSPAAAPPSGPAAPHTPLLPPPPPQQASRCNVLGQFDLTGLPPGPKGGWLGGLRAACLPACMGTGFWQRGPWAVHACC